MERYRQLPAEAFEQRLMTISVVGELQRADAMPMLQDVVWAPLPEESSMPEGLSPRDIQEMIQTNAVQGLCFLGSAEGYKAVMDVILNHESLHVRIEAIDAYMWNHGDSEETAAHLFKTLPEAFHKYVERPRFHAGMDVKDFNERLSAWREKWGNTIRRSDKN